MNWKPPWRPFMAFSNNPDSSSVDVPHFFGWQIYIYLQQITVNLTPSNWFGWHAQIEKPLARLKYTFVLFAAVGSTWPTGPLSNAPFKTKCGTLGACILFPRKDIQLRRKMPLLSRVNWSLPHHQVERSCCCGRSSNWPWHWQCWHLLACSWNSAD